MKNKILLTLSLFLLFIKVSFAQWLPQTSQGINPNHVVLSMAAVDENVVWAVVDTNFFNGPTNFTPHFLRTINGGTTWETGVVTGVENAWIMDITAIDANTAWVTTNTFAGSGGIYKTADGGASWVKQAAVQSVFIHFFDAQNGVEINHDNVYTTANGGTTWTRVASGNVPPFLSGEFNILFSTNNARAQVGDTIWVGTSKGRVFRSTDRGQNWTVSQTSLGQSAVISSLAFRDGMNGIAVSILDGNTFDYTANKMAATTDGGMTWTNLTAPSEPTAANITYVPGTAQTYVLTSSNDPIPVPASGSAYTIDGGSTWSMIDNVPYNSVAFVSPNVGWAGALTTSTHGGMYKWSGPAVSVSDGKDNLLPEQFELRQNHPNPFNPSTTIPFALAKHATVKLTVFDILGREVAVLVDEALAPGTHEVVFDANGLASGVYVYRLQAGALVQTKKLMLLR